MLASLLGALVIFSLRLIDVSVGTVRVMYTVQGRRYVAACLGLVESGVFIFAVSTVLTGARDHIKMIGYAMGFACGTLLGVTVEKMIASGQALLRVIGKDADSLASRLRADGVGVTVLRGEGRDGEVDILFMAMPRRRIDAAVRTIREHDADAFITVEPISRAIGGHNLTSSPLFLFRK